MAAIASLKRDVEEIQKHHFTLATSRAANHSSLFHVAGGAFALPEDRSDRARQLVNLVSWQDRCAYWHLCVQGELPRSSPGDVQSLEGFSDVLTKNGDSIQRIPSQPT